MRPCFFDEGIGPKEAVIIRRFDDEEGSEASRSMNVRFRDVEGMAGIEGSLPRVRSTWLEEAELFVNCCFLCRRSGSGDRDGFLSLEFGERRAK
jgi:hypothetical protein